MIRFLIICTVFLLLYLGFNIISEYDSIMQLSVFDYQVQTTFFAFMAIFAAIQIALMIFLKIVFLILDIPNRLKRRWHKRKILRMNDKLLVVLSQMFMGNDHKALSLMSKLVPDLDENNKETINLIKSVTETTSEKKVQHLKSLIGKKHYSIYAAKKLSEILYQDKHYKQAEEYALKAFDEDDTDTELMLMLIRIYAALEAWHKLVFIVSKIKRADSKLLKKHSVEIAVYYYEAAKAQLKLGSDNNALMYLESALELRPDYLEALNLFVDLSINLQNTVYILKILKAAFLSNPCFEIARMYVASARNSAEANYGILASMANPTQYPDLFLAMATYLDLPDKVASLKSSKPLAYTSSVDKMPKSKP